MLAKEVLRKKEEEEKRRKEEEHKQNEAEEIMNRELANKEKEEAAKIADELRQKEKEDLDRETQEHNTTQDNPESLPFTSRDILTGGHLPIVELGLVPFNSSKQHEVANLENVFFDPKWKSIVWRSENTLKMGTQPKVTTVTEKIVVKNIEEDPEHMASIGIATAQENAYNVSKLKGAVDQYKDKMA